MNQHPFSYSGPANQHDPLSAAGGEAFGAGRPPGGGTKTLLIVLGSIGAVLLLGCLGVVGVGYTFLNQYAGADTEIALPSRPATYSEDLQRFNERLAAHRAAAAEDFAAASAEAAEANAGPVSTHPLQSEVTRWFEQSVDAHKSGVSIPTSTPMFLEAARASHLATKLPLAGRVAMKLSVEEQFPEPELESYYTILGIDFDESHPLATVHFITYDGWSIPYSMQWFLIKESGQWKLYDWQRLEYGRRTSDEFAGYFSNLWHDDNAGYDEAMAVLGEATSVDESAGEVSPEVRLKLRRLENKAMLPHDRSLALLRTAWTWQSLGDQAEALRVLSKIPSQQLRLGVLPTRMYAAIATGDLQQAQEAVEQLQIVSPEHPILHDARGDLLSQQGITDEAVDSYLKALRICPQWQMLRSAVVANAKPRHVAPLLAIAAHEESPLSEVIHWTERWMSRPAMLDELTQSLRQTPWDSAGFEHLSDGLHAYYIDDYSRAGELLLRARQVAADSEIRAAAARWLETNRLEAGQFSEWISESEDLPKSLASLATQIIDDELEVSPARLRTSLLSVAESSEDALAASYARLLISLTHREDAPAQALEGFERFIADAKRRSQSSTDTDDEAQDDSEDPAQGLLDSVQYEKLLVLLRLNRVMQAIEQSDDDNSMDSVVAYVAASRDVDTISKVIKRLEQDGRDATQARRRDVFRLRAMLANLMGDPAKADALRKQALEVGDELTDGESWHNYHVAHERGEWLVRERVESFAADDADSQQVVDAMRDVAAALHDETSIQRVERIESSRDAEVADASYRTYTLNGFDLVAAGLAEARGDIPRAEDFLRRRLDRLPAEADSRRVQAVRDLVAMLCRNEKLDAAREVAQAVSPLGSDEVPPIADVLLAGHRWDELEELLASSKLQNVADWLVSDASQRQLKQFPEVNTRWLKRFEPVYHNPYQSATIQLLLTQQIELDPVRLAEQLEVSFYQALHLGKVQPLDTTATDVAWLLSVGDDEDAYLISLHRDTTLASYETLGPIAQRALDRCSWSLDIVAPNEGAEAMRNSWRILEALLQLPGVDEAALACYCSSSENILWAAEEPRSLAPRLRWQQRMPVDQHTWIGTYLSRRSTGEPQHPAPSFRARYARWTEAMDAATPSIPAQLQVEFGNVTELVACEITGLDEQKQEATIRMRGSSQLRPWLRPGVQCRTFIANLRDETP